MKYVVRVYRCIKGYYDVPITADTRGEVFTKANAFLAKHGENIPWADHAVNDMGIDEVMEVFEEGAQHE